MFDRWKKIFAMVRMSLRSLMLHKLRSFLTILGLVFGVASVIIMLSIAEGAGRDALRRIESLGINNVIVRSIKPTGEDRQERSGILEYGLTFVDMKRIEETLNSVEAIAPFREFNYEARHFAQMLEVRLVGLEPSYAKTNRLELASGRFIRQSDLDASRNVCVLGSEVAQRLFPGETADKKTILIADRIRFEVVGVIAHKQSSGGIGSSLTAADYNRDIYIPLTTDHDRFGKVLRQSKEGESKSEKVELTQLTVRVNHPDDVRKTAASIESLLLATHDDEDFRVTVPLDLLEQRKASERTFNFLLGSIAAISLLVGGIGIMNIMLATVSERTGEIGIRRALGATQGDITFQFLVETLVLSASGAIIGALVGLSAPPLISILTGRETALTFWGPFIAVTVALLTGLVFGIYPAKRAASLDPIEALRRL